jgi:hypothetical protein
METIRIIYEALLGLLVIYVAFIKSYIKEKGKNLATKQDIGSITEIMEQTKHDFDLKTDKIKQQIQFLNQKKFSFIEEEKDSIINFYEVYYKLLNQLMNVSSTFISDLGSEEIIRINKLIDNLQIEFDSASGRLGLFYDSNELIEAQKNLVISTIELKKLVTIFFIDMNLNLKKTKISEELPESQSKQDQIFDHINKNLELSKTFYNERLEKYKIVYQNLLIVRTILRDRLEKILNE